jgi:hypothetical protein
MVYERKSSTYKPSKKPSSIPGRTPKAQRNYLSAIVGTKPVQEVNVAVSQVIRNAATEKRVELNESANGDDSMNNADSKSDMYAFKTNIINGFSRHFKQKYNIHNIF